MKPIIAFALVASLSACSLPEGVDTDALAKVAVDEIQILNDAGIDPINADPEVLSLIRAGCAFAPALYPDMADDIAAACAVASKVAE